MYYCLAFGLPKRKYVLHHAASELYLKTGRGTSFVFMFGILFYNCQMPCCPGCKVISGVRAGRSCHQLPDTQTCADGTKVVSFPTSNQSWLTGLWFQHPWKAWVIWDDHDQTGINSRNMNFCSQIPWQTTRMDTAPGRPHLSHVRRPGSQIPVNWGQK